LTQTDQIQFSDRFFQRGFTRRECIENWSFRRPSFLAQLKKTQALPELLSLCEQFTDEARVAVLYSKMSLDSFFVLPYVMETFKTRRNVTVRYFCNEYFFPFFKDKISREFPKIFVLNSDGFSVATWGPRVDQPELLSLDDEALSQFAIMNYPAQLDKSLEKFFSNHLG